MDYIYIVFLYIGRQSALHLISHSPIYTHTHTDSRASCCTRRWQPLLLNRGRYVSAVICLMPGPDYMPSFQWPDSEDLTKMNSVVFASRGVWTTTDSPTANTRMSGLRRLRAWSNKKVGTAFTCPHGTDGAASVESY